VLINVPSVRGLAPTNKHKSDFSNSIKLLLKPNEFNELISKLFFILLLIRDSISLLGNLSQSFSVKINLSKSTISPIKNLIEFFLIKFFFNNL